MCKNKNIIVAGLSAAALAVIAWTASIIYSKHKGTNGCCNKMDEKTPLTSILNDVKETFSKNYPDILKIAQNKVDWIGSKISVLNKKAIEQFESVKEEAIKEIAEKSSDFNEFYDTILKHPTLKNITTIANIDAIKKYFDSKK